MPAVLRSIGSDPAPADEASLARCQSAVDVVHRDLDVTGYGRYQMRARFGRGWPAWVYPTLPDGSYSGGAQGMPRQEEGAGLLCSAAGSVSATLKEIPEIEWPVCAVDGGHPASIWDGEDPVDVLKKRPGGGGGFITTVVGDAACPTFSQQPGCQLSETAAGVARTSC